MQLAAPRWNLDEAFAILRLAGAMPHCVVRLAAVPNLAEEQIVAGDDGVEIDAAGMDTRLRVMSGTCPARDSNLTLAAGWQRDLFVVGAAPTHPQRTDALFVRR